MRTTEVEASEARRTTRSSDGGGGERRTVGRGSSMADERAGSGRKVHIAVAGAVREVRGREPPAEGMLGLIVAATAEGAGAEVGRDETQPARPKRPSQTTTGMRSTIPPGAGPSTSAAHAGPVRADPVAERPRRGGRGAGVGAQGGRARGRTTPTRTTMDGTTNRGWGSGTEEEKARG